MIDDWIIPLFFFVVVVVVVWCDTRHDATDRERKE